MQQLGLPEVVQHARECDYDLVFIGSDNEPLPYSALLSKQIFWISSMIEREFCSSSFTAKIHLDKYARVAQALQLLHKEGQFEIRIRTYADDKIVQVKSLVGASLYNVEHMAQNALMNTAMTNILHFSYLNMNITFPDASSN